jgi:alpha-beta hydrolase superfamily lysophospholipase
MEGDASNGVYFDSSGRSLFGWLHSAPKHVRASACLVICKPFGYESICAHLGMRGFATAVAAAGIPTLRFDYAGSGDSMELPADADQLSQWTDDVCAAIRAARSLTGADRVYLLGLRLGGLLALLASRREGGVSGIALIAPVLSGRKFLREVKITQLSGGAAAAQAKSEEGEASLEIAGFEFHGATLKSLKAVDFTPDDVPGQARVLVIDGEKMPMSKTWAEGVAARDQASISYVQLPGLVEFLMTAPQFVQMPQRMIDEVSGWLVAAEALHEAGVSRDPRPDTVACAEILRSSCSWVTAPAGRTLTETAVNIRESPRLFGVLTTPDQSEKRRRGVILLNAGSDFHIGASGMYVTLARKWAAAGYFVLRLDLGGLGDSDPHPGRELNTVFPPTAVPDIATAIAWLRERHRIGEIVLGGLCSGAYHALQAAVSRLQVQRVFMVNPETFFWNEEMNITDIQTVELVLKPTVYRSQFLSLETWKRVFTGKVDVPYVARIYIRKTWLHFGSLLRDFARRVHVPLANDLGQQLEEIARRGISLVFVFADGEPGLEILRIQGGVSLKRLGNRCRIHQVPGADHVFSKKRTRMELVEILSRELYAADGPRTVPIPATAISEPPLAH